MDITGKDIINALNELKRPANITEIVEHLHTKNMGSQTDLLVEATTVIDAGLRFGCIVEDENDKFRLEQQIENDDANKGPTKEKDKTISSVNEIHPSDDGTNKTKYEEDKTTKGRGRPTISSEDEDENEDENDKVVCYGPSARRRRRRSGKRRSRSRSSRRRRRSSRF